MFKPDESLQTSHALVALPNAENPNQTNTLGMYDYMTKSFAFVNPAALYWLQYFRDTKSWSQVAREHQNFTETELDQELSPLLDAKFIYRVGSALWLRSKKFRESWKWDLTTSLFHFTVTDNEFVSPQDVKRYQIDKSQREASPDLMWKNGPEAIQLPSPWSGRAGNLLSFLARRRTNRTSSGHSLTKSELSKCLFSGLGIVGFTEGTVGPLPLSMTPSGGARNPFEAYVILKRGNDLDSGVYHYSALEHSLKNLDVELTVEISTLFANQEWIDDMAAVVVLVGIFERSMWKYPDPNAYRVIMMEAGHVVQNAMLAATELGLCACPTAALSHKNLSGLFLLDEITHVPLYAFTIDRPLAYPDQFKPNEVLTFVDQW